MKTTSKNRVLVSVINWNNSKATEECVKSLLTQTEHLDIVVSDNDSRIEDFALAPDIVSKVTVWKNDHNLGFAGGHNKTIQYALENKYELILLMNNDAVFVENNGVSELVKCIRESGARAVAPLIVYEQDRDTVWFGGGVLDVASASSRHLHVGNPVTSVSTEPTEVSFLTGCCLLVRLDGVRLMDERYFLYWEDADWCADALARNEKLVFCPEAVVAHSASMSLGIRSSRYAYYNIRNQLLFARKWSKKRLPNVLLSTMVTATKYIILTTLHQPLKAPGLMYTTLKAQYHGLIGKTGQL